MPDPVRVGDAELYTGDVLSVLAGMADESVHCVVTSPPYWGLRDYGTGTWEGGEPGCDHRANGERRQLPHGDGRLKDSYADERHILPGVGAMYKEVCGNCGARRIDQQIGLEETPEQYVAKMVAVFREVRRVLRRDGTCWVNLGDSYAGGTTGRNDAKRLNEIGSAGGHGGGNHASDGKSRGTPPGLKAKDLVGIPWRVAFALQADGWYLRSDIIWSKPNPMPESVTDRPTKAHEYLFLMSKSPRYFYDAEAVREAAVEGGKQAGIVRSKPESSRALAMGRNPSGNEKPGADYINPAGRNRRTVWTIATEPYPEAHFATFPRKLVEPCILAGCPRKVCPECGAPWVREVEKSRTFESGSGKSGNPINGKQDAVHGGGETLDIRRGPVVHVNTIGEHPTCACGLPPIGGTVMDIFGGSGTTAEVALEYGRRAILIELKPEYVALAKRRLEPVAGRPMLNFAGEAATDTVGDFS